MCVCGSALKFMAEEDLNQRLQDCWVHHWASFWLGPENHRRVDILWSPGPQSFPRSHLFFLGQARKQLFIFPVSNWSVISSAVLYINKTMGLALKPKCEFSEGWRKVLGREEIIISSLKKHCCIFSHKPSFPVCLFQSGRLLLVHYFPASCGHGS